MQPLELLAPAGDLEKLDYALAYGADAVYAGQPQYSLRARENGFNKLEDVRKGIEMCRAKGKKFYLTSNILPHNNKIGPFEKSLDEYIALGPDALIMSDPGMIRFVRKKYPQMPVHLSVQANCTNWSSALFWYELGIERIILSRELRLREIEEIHTKVPGLELEVFVHGAICMAHSGRCMLSNYMNFRDSNQGMCSNACRFKYQLYSKNEPQSEEYVALDGEFYLKETDNPDSGFMQIDEDQYGTYIMNAKDMCAIEHLDALAAAGVCSFKIEGRTKSIYYLSQIVRSYRGALDNVLNGEPIDQRHIDNAYKTDSRGYMPGFFKPSPANAIPQNYETTRVVSETGVVVAFVRSYAHDKKRAQLSVKGQFKNGDVLELITPSSSWEIRAEELLNHKREAVERLNPGQENCSIALLEDPGEYAYLVKRPHI